MPKSNLKSRGAKVSWKKHGVIAISLANTDKVSLIDESDWPIVKDISWRLMNNHADRGYIGNFYAMSPGNIGKLMHRVIMNPDKGKVIDHVNGNGLDNRRENLRISNGSKNNLNYHKSHKKKVNKELPAGVYYSRLKRKGWKNYIWNNSNKHFGAAITINKKRNVIGLFATIEEAGMAYQIERSKLLSKMYENN